MKPDDKKTKPEELETLEDSQSDDADKAFVPGSEIKPAGDDEKTQNHAPTEDGSIDNTDEPKPPKRRISLANFSNLYLIIYIVLIALAIAAGIFTLKNNDGSKQQNKKSSSLTSDQLAQLSGNTTIVGDAKQTLDIQSNTVMEGQLLVRKDLNVAGSIKVGGGLSLTSVQVGGQGNFGQLQINGTLSVSGNTTFSGQLSIQKNLNVTGSGSFGGSLTATQLSVTSLQLNGDLRINRHIRINGSLPTRTNGTSLGSGGTASVNGSDAAGTVTINTGSSPSAGSLITVHFASKFTSTPHVVVTPVGSAASALRYYVTRNTSGFTLFTSNAPSAGVTFSFDYIAID